jgi:preprotein translocase subunit SecA
MVKLFSFEKNLWNKYNQLISSINQLEPELESLSENELKEKSTKLKEFCLETGTNINSKILIESFALVREASRRTLGLRHYDTQLIGGLVLNENKIVEMRTGEGKTLVATAPAFTNALSGKGVHIVTVNEYLAQRDAEWMGQIYRFLGLKVGLVQSQMESHQRRKNYNRDITYITNSELGFDFLRDNLVTQMNDLVQRPFNFCIIDEVDSILIDEARTPLIISGQSKVEIEKIIKATEVVKFLSEFKDYDVDQKSKSISLTSLGIRKAQKLLKVDNIYNSGEPWIPFILNALKAKTLFLKDVHYIVKNNEIVIVDEFTGRIMEGRKWAEGLHSAIEAKENIYNMEGSETIASITYQNFFRLYPKIAGMTGTAKTEELEFENIYNLSVSVLPTFKKIQRQDLPDAIYIDEISKWKAVAQECKKMYQVERPVLVGTTTIQNSEILSLLLFDYNIPHELLNAKPENIKRESEIIAQAGCLSSVTIATNMAGRGTDVLLGGNPEFKAYRQTTNYLRAIINNEKIEEVPGTEYLIQQLKLNRKVLITLQNNFETLLNVINIPNKNLNLFENLILELYKLILHKYQSECSSERKKVLELGGLYVIGTERHESRRIDNQLRGRAGRQGDPGTSRFFLSLNDPLLKTFGGDKIKGLMQTFQMNDEALESKFLSQALDSAQQKVEGFYYDQRKNVNKYDRVLDKQRSILYKFRKKVLVSSTIRDLFLEFGEAIIDDLIQFIKTKNNKVVIPKRIDYLLYALNLSLEPGKDLKENDLTKLKALLYEQFWSVYSLKELNFWFYDIELFRRYEKVVVLKYIDLYWSKHLENMKFLKDAVTWEAYAQKDPFIQYEEQASILFYNTFKQCRDGIIYELLSMEIL